MKTYVITEKQLETLREISETLEDLPGTVEAFDFGEDVYAATENEISDSKKDLKYLIEDIEQKGSNENGD